MSSRFPGLTRSRHAAKVVPLTRFFGSYVALILADVLAISRTGRPSSTPDLGITYARYRRDSVCGPEADLAAVPIMRVADARQISRGDEFGDSRSTSRGLLHCEPILRKRPTAGGVDRDPAGPLKPRPSDHIGGFACDAGALDQFIERVGNLARIFDAPVCRSFD